MFLSGVATALTAMGGMALMLSIVGIYALLSFMVTRRTREIGIRVALGAQSWQVLRSITGAATAYLLIGGVIGTGLGVLFAQLRSMILISIPDAGRLDAGDDLPHAGRCGIDGVLGAGASSARHSACGSAQQRLVIQRARRRHPNCDGSAVGFRDCPGNLRQARSAIRPSQHRTTASRLSCVPVVLDRDADRSAADRRRLACRNHAAQPAA